MDDISVNTIQEINRLHLLASKTAEDAMGYAMKAGQLLLEIKKQSVHGEFGAWIERNLSVSVRQAQRYMAVAEGKELPIRSLSAKSDTMSDSEKLLTYCMPTWVPEAGHWYYTMTDCVSYWVIPDIKDSSRFHISKLSPLSESELEACEGEDEDDSDEVYLERCTRWSEHPMSVDYMLRLFGLADPAAARWKFRIQEGSVAPFCAPEDWGKIKIKDKNGNDRWIDDAS